MSATATCRQGLLDHQPARGKSGQAHRFIACELRSIDVLPGPALSCIGSRMLSMHTASLVLDDTSESSWSSWIEDETAVSCQPSSLSIKRDNDAKGQLVCLASAADTVAFVSTSHHCPLPGLQPGAPSNSSQSSSCLASPLTVLPRAVYRRWMLQQAYVSRIPRRRGRFSASPWSLLL